MTLVEAPRYQAFISYSHRDSVWGDWLHCALERYRVPKALVGTAGERGDVPARIFPVFRDREELSSSSDLSASIRDALVASKCLVVICSPNAARSRWVEQEIREFKALGREERVLCLIVDGEPNTSDIPGREGEECFPQAVRFRVDREGQLSDERTEVIAADARPHADGKLNARLRLAAGILGVRFDDLKQRDLRYRQRRLFIATAVLAAVTVITTTLAVAAWFGWQRAERQEALALNARDQAERIASTMLFDFRDKLEPLGRLDLLKENALVVRDYYLSLPTEHQSDRSERQRASALMNVGDVLLAQGALEEAKAAFDASQSVIAVLRDRHPANVDTQRSWTVITNRMADERLRAGDLDAARRLYIESITDTRALREAGNSSADTWDRNLSVALYKLGQLELEAGRLDAAVAQGCSPRRCRRHHRVSAPASTF